MKGVVVCPQPRVADVGEVMRLPDYARTLERIARAMAAAHNVNKQT